MPYQELPEERIVADFARRPSLTYAASLEDGEDFMPGARAPADSHYELPVTNNDEIDDSQVELPAFTAGDAPLSDDFPAPDDETPSEEIVIAGPGSSDFIGRAGRNQLAVTLAIGAISLAILAFFVLQAVLKAQTVSSSITALVAGCVGLGGFVLLLLSMTQGPLNPRAGQLAKILHRPRPRGGLDSPISGE